MSAYLVTGTAEGGEITVEVPADHDARRVAAGWEIGHGPLDTDPSFVVAVELEHDEGHISAGRTWIFREPGDSRPLKQAWIDEAVGWVVGAARDEAEAEQERHYREASPAERRRIDQWRRDNDTRGPGPGEPI